jgi:hypothetical protein
MKYLVPLLTSLQFQSYLVPCISARIFIIPKLRNIYCELFFSLCIEHLPYCYSYSVRHYYDFLISDRSLREHLSRAAPTEMIFNQLRSIPSRSDRYIRGHSTELTPDTLEIIIQWFQVSVSECYFALKIRFVSRDLDPSDRATCTFASRVNFVDTKLSLNFYVEVRGLSVVSPAMRPM